MTEQQIEEKILESRSELKTDRLDMSFGEIMNLYNDGDLIITPEYQRAYRWSDDQKTKFIESVLLGIPIPPIFIAEDNEGKWELVDGLQRLSTILSFFNLLKNDLKKNNNFPLIESELTHNILVGLKIDNLSTKLKLTIKRAVCRVEILRWDSSFDMRYELFNRLNTGSSPLKQQEIRNCVLQGEFNTLLKDIVKENNFNNIIEINDKKIKIYENEMYLEELVLRYFSLAFGDLKVNVNMPNYLTSFMKKVNTKKIEINYKKEKKKLSEIVCFIDDNATMKFFQGRNNRFSENLYDSFMYLLHKNFKIIKKNPKNFLLKCEIIKDDIEYKRLSGFQTGQKDRLSRKIKRAEEIFND